LVIVEIAFATGTPLHTGGSNTLQRSDLRKGLEPDDCYWIQHAEEIRGKTRVHLDELPAPDLVIEIDVTHTSVNRAEILAAMGVPEMWVWKLGRFSAFKLVDGVWTPTEYSVAFPMLKVNDISVFFQKLWDFRELEVLSEVRKWSSTLEKARGA
jgi:Uma2 family endonuclease